jgi:hypothetical protein
LEPHQHHAPNTPHTAQIVFGGPLGLLRSAAAAIADAGSDHAGGDSNDPAEQEIRALSRFGHESGLMLAAPAIQSLFANPDDFLGQGMEHTVVVLRGEGLVLKDYDTQLFNEVTGEVFYKPAELVFDYLTDHLLANHFFGDDIQLKGLYEDQGSLHVVISQPFVHGRHPSWQELVERLESQGLEHESPGTPKARFWIDAGDAGRVLVTDVHEDNVIFSNSDAAHPIDVHFAFGSRAARCRALDALGLLK